MELSGHPTQDIVEELKERGATVFPGSNLGPDAGALAFREGGEAEQGLWIYLPKGAYETEIDETFPAL